MNKKEIAKHMVTIGIFTLITTFFVVSLQSYRNLIKEKEEVGEGLKLDPINPEIKMDLLDEIQARKEYSFNDIRIVTPTPIPTATPSEEEAPGDEIPTSSPSGQLTDE